MRSGHIDFFFAYPADYADILIGYEDGGNFARRQWKPAFEVILSYDRLAGPWNSTPRARRMFGMNWPPSSCEPF